MSFYKIHSAQSKIFNADPVDVEIDISNGLHSFVIVGLAGKSIEESRDRISSAIKNSGYTSPKQKNQKVVISLTPADIRKNGTNFDVPMALAYLIASGQIKDVLCDKKLGTTTSQKIKRLFVGELSLDGKIKPIKGILQTIIYAKNNNFDEVFIPIDNRAESELISGIKIYLCDTLANLVDFISGKNNGVNGCNEQKFVDEHKNPATYNGYKWKHDDTELGELFNQIHGNEIAKRGLLISGSGGHNIAFWGPPGTGKSMLAKSFIEILPNLSEKQIIESNCIYSSLGVLKKPVMQAPFRAPHHTSSYVSIIGGGNNSGSISGNNSILNIGEITLAHNGVLFMDEFPEFDKRVIDSLRQPIEDKIITISRSNGTETFPCNFILIVAMNPCKCGFFKSGIKKCTCTQNTLQNYRRKISGPIIDRIDIWIEVSKIDHKNILNHKNNLNKINEASLYKEKIKSARKIQLDRNGKLNNQLDSKEILKYCQLDIKTKKFLENSAEKLKLSTRSYLKIIKLARTIADIENSEKIKEPHILEALQYRPREI